MDEITTINPTTEAVLNRYPLMDQAEVEQLIEEVTSAQQTWAESAVPIRKKYLLIAADLLRQNKKEYATLITEEMGKPLSQAVSEIEKCAVLFDYYAKEGESLLKSETIKSDFYRSYRTYTPLGIIFAIMPWNFPFWQVARFAAPNLLLGNAGILKHSPNTTGCSLAIEKLFANAGFPDNLFRSVVIDVSLAPFIIHHKKIAGVTLTGSNKAGQSVAKEAGIAIKKTVLELGGSDPYVILADADLDFAAEQCVTSRLGINTGQSCIAAKRLIVVQDVLEEFNRLILEKAQRYACGNPISPETQLGPLAREDLRAKLHHQVQLAVTHGARCLLGGALPKGKGFFYPATVLFDVKEDSPAFTEELFGPVICVTAAKDPEDAIRLANHTDYGLGAAIFTRNLKRGEEIARDKLQAGSCFVNRFVSSDPRLPFGGIKQSGYGRELAAEGLHEFANVKTVVVNKL